MNAIIVDVEEIDMPKNSSQIKREIDQCLAGASVDSGAVVSPPALGAILGRTASGKMVVASTRSGAPDTNDVIIFRKTKAKFPGWSKEDHMDAERLFDEAAQLAGSSGDRKLASTLSRWGSVHWDIGGRWTSPESDQRDERLGRMPRTRR